MLKLVSSTQSALGGRFGRGGGHAPLRSNTPFGLQIQGRFFELVLGSIWRAGFGVDFGTHFGTHLGIHLGIHFGVHFGINFGAQFGIHFGVGFVSIWVSILASILGSTFGVHFGINFGGRLLVPLARRLKMATWTKSSGNGPN